MVGSVSQPATQDAEVPLLEPIGNFFKGFGQSLGLVAEDEEDMDFQSQFGDYATTPMYEPDPSAFQMHDLYGQRSRLEAGEAAAGRPHRVSRDVRRRLSCRRQMAL